MKRFTRLPVTSCLEVRPEDGGRGSVTGGSADKEERRGEVLVFRPLSGGPRWRFLAWLTAVTITLLLAVTNQTSGAQRGKSGGSSSSNVGSAWRQLQQAQMELAHAQQQVQAAIRQRGRLKKQLEEEKENDEELRAAQTELEQAQRELSEIRHRVLVLLEDDAEYKEAVTAVQQAEKRLKELQAEGNADETALAAARRELGRLRNVVAAMESKALQKDPEYQRAERKVAAARRRLAAVSKKLDEKYQSDPRLKAAEEQIAKAKQAVVEASRKVAQARQNLSAVQAAAAKEWQKRVYESLRRRVSGRKGGRRRRHR